MRAFAGNQISCGVAKGKSGTRGVFGHDDVLIFETGAEDRSAADKAKILFAGGRDGRPTGFVDRQNMSFGVGDCALIQKVSNAGNVFHSINHDRVIVPGVVEPDRVAGSSKGIISVIEDGGGVAFDFVVDQRGRVGHGGVDDNEGGIAADRRASVSVLDDQALIRGDYVDPDVHSLNISVEDERAIRAVRGVDVDSLAGCVVRVAEDPVSLELERVGLRAAGLALVPGARHGRSRSRCQRADDKTLMAAFEHQIVNVEKTGGWIIVGIVQNADGSREVIAIDADSRKSRAGRIVKGNHNLGQIRDDFRLRLSGYRGRNDPFESGADRNFITFERDRTAGPDEPHALGYLECRRHHISVRRSACKLDRPAFRPGRGQSLLNRMGVVGRAVADRWRGRKRLGWRLGKRSGTNENCKQGEP